MKRHEMQKKKETNEKKGAVTFLSLSWRAWADLAENKLLNKYEILSNYDYEEYLWECVLTLWKKSMICL